MKLIKNARTLLSCCCCCNPQAMSFQEACTMQEGYTCLLCSGYEYVYTTTDNCQTCAIYYEMRGLMRSSMAISANICVMLSMKCL